jgi:CubicO group peptidase (beta-lactamase class C family)
MNQRTALGVARGAAAILAATLVGGCAGGGADPIDSFVRAEMARQKVPGVAVAVVRKGEVVKTQGYGEANVEHHIPVKPETVFQSGSVGKMFTAAAVMLLAEDGRLALADSVRRHFPDAPAAWEPITIRHMLTHTSGIPDYTPGTIDFQRDYSEEELRRIAYGLKPEFPAGARWSYSNTAYDLLGLIVGRASGRFYGDLLQERVFAPLGMKTAQVISEEKIVPNRAAGYRLADGELRNQEWVAPGLNTLASGSLYLSILDLIAWDRGVRSGAVLKPESWKEVYEPVRLHSGRTYPYGFGWSVDDVAGRRVHQHSGSWQGFKTYLRRYLDDDLAIIVLANLAETETERFVDGIAAAVDPELARPEPSPLPDADPEVTVRLGKHLAATAAGTLAPADLAYAGAGFFPDAAKEYQEMLRGLGEPRALTLFERRELGDDRVFRYEATYAGKTVVVWLSLAPDGKVAELEISPQKPKS